MYEERAISYDHRSEEAIVWIIRWEKKQESVLKPFPMTIGVKKT